MIELYEYISAWIITVIIFTSPIWITIIIVLVIRKNKKKQQMYQQRVTNITNQQPQPQPQTTTQENTENNIYNPYVINKYLLTNKERLFYNSLKQITDKYDYVIFSKMRIADIVSINAPKNEYMALFNKINKKHIDFIICNSESIPLLLIEIDDYTHDRQDRKERDKFVDSIFINQGIQLLHIRRWGNDLESLIIEAITYRKIEQHN